jgi:hypothetical protein
MNDDEVAALQDDPALSEDKDDEHALREGNGKNEGNDLLDDPRSEQMDDEVDSDTEQLNNTIPPEETIENDNRGEDHD